MVGNQNVGFLMTRLIMSQYCVKFLKEENVTHLHKIHGKLTKQNKTSKLNGAADFKINVHSDCMFPSLTGGRGWKKLGIMHSELLFSHSVPCSLIVYFEYHNECLASIYVSN